MSHTGNRTRIGRVRACYPNQLDYMGSDLLSVPLFIKNISSRFAFHSNLCKLSDQ